MTMRTRYWLLVAAILALASVAIAANIILSRPVHLRAAVGPDGGVDAKLIAELDHVLDAARSSVRLDVVTTPGIHESNVLLDKREADLAVVRADDPLPTHAALVAILRMNVAVVAAPARHKFDSISDLKGKRLGLVARTSLDEAATRRLIELLGMKGEMNLTLLKPDEVNVATKSGRVDAVAVIGAPADADVAAVVYAVDAKPKSPPTILAIDLGDYVKENSPAASSETIAKRTFTRRGIPDDDVESVGVPTVLAANTAATGPLRAKLYNNAITDLTKTLLERHGEMARKVPLASLVKAPDDDKSSRFPVHPGTTAYIGDTDVSWYTLFSDQIWNVMLVGGLLSSVFAATYPYFKPQQLDRLTKILERLTDITNRAQASPDRNEHAALSSELGQIGIEIARHGYERRSSYEQLAPIQMAYDAARRAVEGAGKPSPRPGKGAPAAGRGARRSAGRSAVRT